MLSAKMAKKLSDDSNSFQQHIVRIDKGISCSAGEGLTYVDYGSLPSSILPKMKKHLESEGYRVERWDGLVRISWGHI